MSEHNRRERIGAAGAVALVMAGMFAATTGCQPAGPRAQAKGIAQFCEYAAGQGVLVAPVPRFTWYKHKPQRGEIQTAYRIQVASDPSKASGDTADVWDSGKVVSSRSAHVEYAGAPLKACRDYVWRVRIWDAQDNPSGWSGWQRFHVGPTKAADWQARWIAIPTPKLKPMGPPSDWKSGPWIWHPKTAENQTVFLRKTIEIPAGQKVAEARLRCAADDSFELFFNGKKLGGGSSWQKVYDFNAADHFREGKNVLAVKAVNGSSAAGLRLTMRIVLATGKQIWVLTGKDWKVTDTEQPKWNDVAFVDAGWPAARVIGEFGCEPWGKTVKPPPLPPHRSVMLRKEFTLKRPVRKAWVYICGLGAYRLHLNSNDINAQAVSTAVDASNMSPDLPWPCGTVLTPGWTEFGHRIQYQAYDVTKQLKQGGNAIGAILGNGWWHGRIGGERQQPGRDSLRLIAQLMVQYADGSTETIVTDPSWRGCLSPVFFDSIYDGETYDARLEKPGWDSPGYDADGWKAAELVDQAVDNLVPQAKDTMGFIRTFKPVDVSESDPGVYIVDFGQNLVGWVRLKVQAKAGTKIVMRHAEVMKDGKFYTANLRSAKATDTYICKGEGVEVWEPRFTYHGFRYVEITGYPGKPDDALLAKMVSSCERDIGGFRCSEGVLNKIQHNLYMGLRGNLHSVPTDCPQRDERLGWMGDAQMFANTSCWNLQMGPHYTKWMRDIADCQGDDGAVRDVNPTHWTAPAKPAWGDACVIVPYQVYRHYGDTRIIEENWNCMVRWVDYMTRHSKDYLYERDGYGDWIAVVPSPKKPISAAYYYYDCVLMSEMAHAIGRPAEAYKYADLAHKIRQAFNEKYLDKRTNQYPGGTQTANLLPLFFGIVPEHRVEAVLDNVVRDVLKRGVHLSTGFLGTGYINPVLTAGGHHDLAWKLAVQTTYPSWGYMVKKGATTIWELWNSDTAGPGMNSRNHFCLGSVGEWFFESLAGINPAEPGFKKVLIKPRPVGGLTHATSSVETVRGWVGSSWRLDGGNLTMTVLIPGNTTAEIHVPTFGARQFTISESGTVLVKDGRLVGRAEGITFVGMEDDWAAFRSGAGEFKIIAEGVGRPKSRHYDIPTTPSTLSELIDNFDDDSLDMRRWEVVDLGLESTAPTDIGVAVRGGRLILSGKTNVDYWAGKTLLSRGSFNVTGGKRLTVETERIVLESIGSGARTSLWLYVGPKQYVLFSQDTEAGTWSYNLNGKGGTGVKLIDAQDRGRHAMKMVHDGKHVRFYLDGREIGQVSVGWRENIRVGVSAQVRQKGDSLSATFDGVRAILSEN